MAAQDDRWSARPGVQVLHEDGEVHAALQSYRWELLNLDSYAGRITDSGLDNLERIGEELVPRLAKGVVSKYLMTRPTAGHERLAAIQRGLCEAGEETRVVPALPRRMIIVDRERAAVSHPDDSPGGLLVTDPVLIEVLVADFEHHWARGHDFLVSDNARQVRVRVAELLFEGLTDDAIARRLQMGSRSAARAVAGLMAEHDCQTRFQLGAALAKAA